MNSLTMKETFPQRRAALIRRGQFLRLLRHALDERGYLEVDTPIRVRAPGTDVNIEAFSSEDCYLITSPEFHMKRLLAAGLLRIYQICPCFRKDEKTPLHNPEFRLLEFYASGLSLEAMMQEVEEIIGEITEAMAIHKARYRDSTCYFKAPWKRLSVEEAFQQYAGWSPINDFDMDRFYFDLVDKVEQHLGQNGPTFLYGYPAPLAMLAQLNPLNPKIAQRFELYLAGIEIANGFEELTETQEQRERFKKDLQQRAKLKKPLYPLDEVFLEALGGMPPSTGVALGIDRLAMLLLNAKSLVEVMAFPEEEV